MRQSLIESMLRHQEARASAVEAEAAIVEKWCGSEAARGPVQAAREMRNSIEAWLAEELDVQQAKHETGFSDKWLREKFASSGSRGDRRWLRRTLLAGTASPRTRPHQGAQMGTDMDANQQEKTIARRDAIMASAANAARRKTAHR